MSFHFRSALLVLVASATLSSAQGEAKKELPKSADVEVRMGDGSTMRMLIAQESLTVATRYGKLTVATNEILRIDLGLRMPEGAAAKIDKAVQQLGSREFKEREAASAELLDFGVLAYQPLQRAAKNTDAEVAERANALLTRIREGPGGTAPLQGPRCHQDHRVHHRRPDRGCDAQGQDDVLRRGETRSRQCAFPAFLGTGQGDRSERGRSEILCSWRPAMDGHRRRSGSAR